MGPEYTIDLEQGCIFIKWSGVITLHKFITFNQVLVQDPNYRLGLNRLIDQRGVKIEVSADEVGAAGWEVIKKRDATEGHRKLAVLVGADHVYGIVRMFDMMGGQTRSDVRPFRRLDEAVAWLGLSETLGDPFEANSN